ncbi:universal stress protein [Rufibacter ruber]|uniref:universal stress protein n=1 Tax=Rufibacter ruber TaxID=1783499 RepID=UPI000943671E|nr:universal stress protein [Rufibacter ruber]
METILCPTDFTACSENAIRYAAALGQPMGARLILYHNIYEPVLMDLAPFGTAPLVEAVQDPVYREGQQQKLEALAEAQRESPFNSGVSVECQLSYGHTLDSMVHTLRKEHVDLLVIGHEGFQEVFGYSLTARIIHEAPCPVLVVPPHASFKYLNRIVFATDLKGESFTDLSLVCQIAKLFNAELQLLHILEEDTFTDRQRAQAGLGLLLKRLPYNKVSTHLEVHPEIEEGIHQFCFQQKADLVVIGHRTKNFWQHLFLQDNTRQIAAQTFLPLLVVHHTL